MIGYWRVLRRFNRNTRLFMVVPAAIGISYFGMFVVLFNLYLLRLGYDPRFIGTLNAAGQVAFIALSLPASRLGNRWGSRRPIVLAVTLYLLGFGLLPLAEFAPEGARSLWLAVTFLIAFVGGPFYWVNSNVYLMAVTDPEVRSHAFSVRTALLPLAGFAGSLIGGWLPGFLADARGLGPAAVGPFRDALLLAALLYLPALLAILRAGDAEGSTPEPAQRPRNGSLAIPYGVIVPLVIVDMMRLAAEVGLLGFFNVYLDIGLGVGTSRIGLTVGVALLISGGAALATPLASRRIGHRLTIMIGMVGMALFLLPVALVPTLLAAAIGYTGAIALSSMAASSLSVFRMERVGATLWSLMAGAAATGQGVGEASILFAGGFIITGAGFPAYFVTVAAVALVGALCLWLLVPREPASRNAPPAQLRKEID